MTGEERGVTTSFEHQIYGPDDYKHGYRCADCRREFKLGDPYTERSVGHIGHTLASEIICLACAGEAS